MGEWSRSWNRELDMKHSFLQIAATKERAKVLAELNLPKGTKYILIRFANEWGWLHLGLDAEELVA